MLGKIELPKYVLEEIKEGEVFWTLTDDCPKEVFERCRKEDENFFKLKRQHLFTNFETEK